MRISEVIEIVNNRTPSEYTSADMVRWLVDLDTMIYEEAIEPREGADDVAIPTKDGSNDMLLIPEPYAEDVYVSYLQSKIAKENEEDAKYNIANTLFLAAYSRWTNVYYSKHKMNKKNNFFII